MSAQLSEETVKTNITLFLSLKDGEKICIQEDGSATLDDRYWQSLRRTTDRLTQAQRSDRESTYDCIRNTYNSLRELGEIDGLDNDTIVRSLYNLSTTQAVTYNDYPKMLTLISRFQREFKEHSDSGSGSQSPSVPRESMDTGEFGPHGPMAPPILQMHRTELPPPGSSPESSPKQSLRSRQLPPTPPPKPLKRNSSKGNTGFGSLLKKWESSRKSSKQS
jgi:hypothetical protein